MIHKNKKITDKKSFLFPVGILLPWLFLNGILLARTSGHLLEGIPAFVLLLISRFCVAISALEILFLLLLFIEPRILRILSFVATLVFIVLMLRNPLADLWCLRSPVKAEVTGSYVTDSDQYVEYSTFYYLEGTVNHRAISFRINRSSYLTFQDAKNQTLYVVYLPHTLHVLKISNVPFN